MTGTVPSDESPDPHVSIAGSAPVRIDRDVVDAIAAHVGEDTSVECGGVLVGAVDGGTTQIRASIRAEHTASSASSLTFTHDTWDAINTKVDRDFPDLRIVGWYHSHPGFSVFLSEYDTFIHRNFFSAEWQVAYVVDPLLKEDGFFGWLNGGLVRFADWDVRAVYGRSGAAVSEPSVSHSDLSGDAGPGQPRRSVVPMIAVGAAALLAGVLGGLALADDPPPPQLTDRSVAVERHDGVIVQRNLSTHDGCLVVEVQLFNPTDVPVDPLVVVDPVPPDLAAAPGCVGNTGPVGPTVVDERGALDPGESDRLTYGIAPLDDMDAATLARWNQEWRAMWETLELAPPSIDPGPLTVPIETTTVTTTPSSVPVDSVVTGSTVLPGD